MIDDHDTIPAVDRATIARGHAATMAALEALPPDVAPAVRAAYRRLGRAFAAAPLARAASPADEIPPRAVTYLPAYRLAKGDRSRAL